jgi:hypothetical protein
MTSGKHFFWQQLAAAHHAESHRAKSMVRNFFSTACVTFSIM